MFFLRSHLKSHNFLVRVNTLSPGAVSLEFMVLSRQTVEASRGETLEKSGQPACPLEWTCHHNLRWPCEMLASLDTPSGFSRKVRNSHLYMKSPDF